MVLILLTLRVGLWPLLFGAIGAGVLWNFIFVPPLLAFSRISGDDATLLTAYLTMALVGHQLARLRLRAAHERLLEESEKLHNVLLDNVSHELKTPVSVLRSAVEQLSVQEVVSGNALFLEIQRATGRLDRLVHNLVSQTRIESGVLKPKMDWCEVGELIEETRRVCAERLEGRLVRVRIAEDMPLVFVDASMMEQVLTNLLINASVHTPRGSEILVSAGVDEALNEVYLQVIDEGPGIPGELLEVVFERFQRGRSERKSGLGLGLSIVKGFIEAQGGRAYAEAPLGGGAVFTVALPRCTPPDIDV